MRRLGAFLVSFATVLAGLAMMSGASAVQVAQDQVVRSTPVGFTPNVLNGNVLAVAEVGNKIILGGSFTQVQNAGSSTTLTRNYLLAFNKTTGVVDTGFAPAVTSTVRTLVPGPDGNSVYVGGQFSNINGVSGKFLRLNTTNGQVISTFQPGVIDAVVYDAKLVDERLFIAGQFSNVGGDVRGKLAELDPSTGAVKASLDLPFAGTHNGGSTLIYKIDVSPDGKTLVAVGNFATVAGSDRMQIAMVDLAASPAVLTDWETDRFKPFCYSSFERYINDVDFSPDGSFFAITTMGGYGSGPPSLCDSVSRWETSARGSAVDPTWVDWSGGDSFYAVAVTGAAIYVGGHDRWTNNPFAADAVGPGAVPRAGIAALDPVNGLPLSWNPGRDRGRGVFDFLATEDGLWVGSDTDRIAGGLYRARIAFFPLAGGTTVPQPTPVALPADVNMLGAPPSIDRRTLYRVNAGGPTLPSADTGPDWTSDGGDQSAYRNGGSNAADWGSATIADASVPSSTPLGVFGTERWSPNDNPPMQWAFPVAAGKNLQVRLYFANRCGCTSGVGQRVFDVALDGTTVLDNFDIVADAGDQVGTMKSFDVVSDGTVNIDFTHVVENPLINAIEIVDRDAPAPVVDRRTLYRVNAGGPSLLSVDSGPDWSGDGGAYRNGGSNAADWGSATIADASVPSSTPLGVFGTERWSPNDNPPMQWAFPVAAGKNLQVRLYFANRCGCTSGVGQRVFDVALDGTTVLDNFDIVADAGDQVGTMKSFDVVSDGTVNIDFTHVVENPLINAIEIVDRDAPAPDPSVLNVASRRTFDGGSSGAASSLPSSSIQWGLARGAFWLDGQLYVAWADGTMTVRSYNGSAFGTPQTLNLYGLGQFAAEMQSMTGLFYENGRIYFTLAGDSHLYSRYFTVESGIVGAMRFATAGPGDGANWSQVRGTFLSGNSLFWVSNLDGSMHRVQWENGAPVDGTDVVVSGPALDGIDWSARALFSSPATGTANQPPVASFTHQCSDTACEFDGSGSYDPDGSVVSYSWDFGDGSSGAGATPSHGYAAPGRYSVTLTVKDNRGATASSTATVKAGNLPPTAAFTATCTQLSCSFDGSGSDDTDGSITSYAWDFGDGSQGDGDTVQKTFSQAGTYTVTLSVTDDLSATSSTSKNITVVNQAVSFVGSAEVNGNSNLRVRSIDVPSNVEAGDVLMLMASTNSASTTYSDPAGWTRVESVTTSAMSSVFWVKDATAGDAGQSIDIATSAYVRSAVTLSAYRGGVVSLPGGFAAAGETTSTTDHTTPALNVLEQGAWVVSYWADKSASTTSWSAPAGQQVRSTGGGTGSGHLSWLLTDSGGPVTVGAVGGLTATADSAVRNAVMATIVIMPTE